MKIVIIQDFVAPYFSGGSAIYVSDIASGLAEQGHEVSILSVKNPNIKNQVTVLPNNIKVKVYPVDTKLINIPVYSHRVRAWAKPWSVAMYFYNPFVYRQIVRILDKIRPDVIHINDSLYLSLSVFTAAYHQRSPTLFTCHFTHLIAPQGLTNFGTNMTPRLNGLNNLVPKITRLIVKSPAVVLYLSNFGKYLHQQFGFFPYSKKVVFPSYSRFSQNKNTGTPDNSVFTILYVGRVDNEKGLRSLTKAMPDIKGKFLINICGSGKDESDLRNQYANDQRIVFNGQVDNETLSCAYLESDIVLLPSTIYEMFPLSAVEALSFGKPVIASNIGGVPDIIHHGQNGLLFISGNSRDIADKINSVIQRGELFHHLTKTAEQERGIYSRGRHLELLQDYYDLARKNVQPMMNT